MRLSSPSLLLSLILFSHWSPASAVGGSEPTASAASTAVVQEVGRRPAGSPAAGPGAETMPVDASGFPAAAARRATRGALTPEKDDPLMMLIGVVALAAFVTLLTYRRREEPDGRERSAAARPSGGRLS